MAKKHWTFLVGFVAGTFLGGFVLKFASGLFGKIGSK